MLYYVAVETTRGTIYMDADGFPTSQLDKAWRFDSELSGITAITRLPERLQHHATVIPESALDNILNNS